MATISSRLNTVTHKLLVNRSRQLTYGIISADTGLGMGWLTEYARGNIPDPSVARVETLYEYLTKTKLQVIAA